MADISKITLPSGTTYNIKDTTAREMASGVIHLIKGENTTPLEDNATTNPITINGESYTAVSGDATFWASKEFVYDGSIWHEFGDLTGLKALAYKDDASTQYTPSGAVSTPTFTGIQKAVNVTGTPLGSVEISVGSGDANYTPSGEVSQPTFTGSVLNSTGVFTPVGAISSSANNDGNYTPSGSISTPVISVAEEGATTTVNSITSVGTLPSLTTTVENETLTISFNKGTLPTKVDDITVKTGDASYSSTQPSFTGTRVNLAFTGEQGNISVSGTPVGVVSRPSFTGSGANLEAVFTGETTTSTGTYTPTGTVSTPEFTGNQATIVVS